LEAPPLEPSGESERFRVDERREQVVADRIARQVAQAPEKLLRRARHPTAGELDHHGPTEDELEAWPHDLRVAGLLEPLRQDHLQSTADPTKLECRNVLDPRFCGHGAAWYILTTTLHSPCRHAPTTRGTGQRLMMASRPVTMPSGRAKAEEDGDGEQRDPGPGGDRGDGLYPIRRALGQGGERSAD